MGGVRRGRKENTGTDLCRGVEERPTLRTQKSCWGVAAGDMTEFGSSRMRTRPAVDPPAISLSRRNGHPFFAQPVDFVFPKDRFIRAPLYFFDLPTDCVFVPGPGPGGGGGARVEKIGLVRGKLKKEGGIRRQFAQIAFAISFSYFSRLNGWTVSPKKYVLLQW